MSIRYSAVIEYDGTAYYGFQRQRTHPSIQEQLEKTLEKITSNHVPVTGAGRTDTGVHAKGQVIAFDLVWNHDAESLLRALNANLPDDIALVSIRKTNADFHARHDAKKRVYTYTIYNSKIRSPLLRRESWHVDSPLNVSQMNKAAALLLGEHDFATFGQPTSGDNTVRRVFEASWSKKDDFFILKIEANAFLYRMVRSLVGSMKAVGEGTWTVNDFRDALEARDRSRSGKTAPANALCLVSVSYD